MTVTGTPPLSQARHVDGFAFGGVKKMLLLWWQGCSTAAIPTGGPHPRQCAAFRLTDVDLISFSFKCVLKQRITCVLPCSPLLISMLGHSLCGLFYPPIWPLDDETLAPVFRHVLSLHIRPQWWRLSVCHSRICPWLINPPHTQITNNLFSLSVSQSLSLYLS